MITDLWIENFKGIGKRQHIPLRPITLLFGANSAGKSTVLHALMYLREILCNRNLNPTKPIAGENTVNLGGLEKLLRRSSEVDNDGHTQETTAKSLTLGCRFVAEPERQMGATFRPWEEQFYKFYMSQYFFGSETPTASDTKSNRPVEYDDSPSDSYTNDLWLTVSSDNPREVKSFEWHVDRQPFLNCWKLPCGDNCCWINVYHTRFNPYLDRLDANSTQDLWSRSLRESAFSNAAGLKDLLSISGRGLLERPFDEDYATFSSPLTCPQWSGRFGHYATAILQSGLDTGESLLSSVILTLAEFTGLCGPVALPAEHWEASSDDVLLGFDQTQSLDESLAGGTTLVFVAIPKHLAEVAGKIIQRIRFLFTGIHLAGDFLVALDEVGLPVDSRPMLHVTDDIGAMYMHSNSNTSWFPQQLARVDQTIRMAIRQLRMYLSGLCYVGPKRSSVPRNLNESVLDEYVNWGNGLGAWRWLLNHTECSKETFEKCSNWLSDPNQGLGTGYLLKRDGILEMTMEQMRQYYRSGCDPEELRHSMRIELHDVRSNSTRHPQEVGEGVTQLVPVIAASVRTAGIVGGGQLVAVEQPELHLHPSLAAKVGDLFTSSAFRHGYNFFSFAPTFLIETHSEHLILRILRRIRQTTDGERPEHLPPVKPDDVCVLWVDNLGDGTTFKRLRIDEHGEFIDRWPKGFFSERAEELY